MATKGMRAYALATELGLAREELIKKAAEIGIEIRNPMASLDEEQVTTIRRRLSATPAADTVQKRVGSSVIRRRKRKEDEGRPEALGEEAAESVTASEPLAGSELELESPALAASAAPSASPAAEPASRGADPRVVTPLDRPARIVEDPLANLPQPAAAEQPAAAAAARPSTAPAAGETEEREADAGGAQRKTPRVRPVRTDVTLREQETIARMMRGGNVQAQLERRRSIVEQQSRAQSQRRRVTPPPRKLAPPNPAKIKRTVKIAREISFVDFSRETGVKVRDLVRRARALEAELPSEEFLEGDIAALVAEELGFAVQRVESEIERKIAATRAQSDAEAGEPRPPVVTVMGHVDHGKTSLLDYIRKANVAAGEAGGITQHIGAYQARTSDGSLVTFIDTPGHAAFSQMRARGAQLTDLVVLVVAADDGVMPQTVEAINHARAAGVPIIVAVNKIDKSDANPQRVRQALLEHQLVAEDFGGDTIFVDVSATKGTGVDKLLEMLALQAEVLELRAPKEGPARGAVLEAELDRGRGPLATVLVRSGTLRPGDAIVAGRSFGRVRSMQDPEGNTVKEAGPSTPVRVIGLGAVPLAGDDFFAAESEREAKQIVDHRITEEKQKTAAATESPAAVTAEELFAKMAGAIDKELFAVVKADVQGTVEAIREALGKLSTEKVKLSVIHSGVGGIKESDVMLAAASKAVIFGFHVRPEPAARKLAEREGVAVRTFDIVYELLDDATMLMRGLLPPKETEKLLGHALVKELFQIPKIGTIAGSAIEDGKITRAARARVLRNGIVIYAGKLSSLRRFKDDVREVASPLECGIGIENFNDVKVGDRIEAYEIEATPDTL
ncbi:MAG TPA: translation initiation factor IF-2 [Myxococcota bacterium]|nr:translation initiation factor IF-2 [Myxococcota bacterium]